MKSLFKRSLLDVIYVNAIIMKQFFSLIIAGIIGGAIALGSAYWLQKDTDQKAVVTPRPQLMTNINSTTPVAGPFDFRAAAELATPVVVHIKATQTDGKQSEQPYKNPLEYLFGDLPFGMPYEDYMPKQGTGSGVIYSADGYIITNNHVVDFADEITVTLSDNRKFEATKVGTYPDADLAVIKIEAGGLPTLQIADSDNAQVGEWVLAVGNPFDLTSTVTAGIISARGRDINAIRSKNASAIESFIQTDAAVNPGNSGGALISADGKLLGINTAIATRTGTFSGYSFAIPINLAKRIVEDIIENGSYERVFLGVEIAELDDDYIRSNQLDFAQGLVVDGVRDGSAAQSAGIEPGDIILDVNGRAIRNFPDLQEIISSARVGDQLNVKLYRDGAYKEILVKL